MKKINGQVAIEYMILLGLMVVIALTAFRTLLPGMRGETELAFNGGAANIVGNVARTSETGPWPFDEPRN